MIRVAVIADTHGEFEQAYPEHLLAKLKNSIDYVFLLGDSTFDDLACISFVWGSIPMYYVAGNHDAKAAYDFPCFEDVNGKAIELGRTGLILTGMEGSVRYKEPEYQPISMTQEESLEKAKRIPKANIIIAHDGPYGCNIWAGKDSPHQGLRGLLWYLKHQKPVTLFFGHHHCKCEIKMKKTHCYGCYMLSVFTLDNEGRVIERQDYPEFGIYD